MASFRLLTLLLGSLTETHSPAFSWYREIIAVQIKDLEKGMKYMKQINHGQQETSKQPDSACKLLFFNSSLLRSQSCSVKFISILWLVLFLQWNFLYGKFWSRCRLSNHWISFKFKGGYHFSSSSFSLTSLWLE